MGQARETWNPQLTPLVTMWQPCQEVLVLQAGHSIGKDKTQSLCSSCPEIPGASEGRGRCMGWEVFCL